MSFFYRLISIPQILRLKKIASKSALYYNNNTIDELDKIISSRPRLAMAYLLRGRAKKGLESIDDFNIALHLNPKYQEAYYFRGHLKDLLGDEEGAYNDYVRTTEVRKTLSDLNQATIAHHIYYNIGSFLLKKGKYEESIEAFNKDIERGYLSIAHLNRGKAKYHLMKYDEAIEDLDKYLSIHKTDQEAYKYRALSKKAIGDLKGFEIDYRLATDEICVIEDEYDNENFIKNTKVVFKNFIPTPSYFDWNNPETHHCPECNSRNIGKLSYGLPVFESQEFKNNKENIILAGCIVSDDSPLYRCKNCGAEWGFVNFSNKVNLDEVKEYNKRKIFMYMNSEVKNICDKKRIAMGSAEEKSIVYDVGRIFESTKRILIDEANNARDMDYDWIYNYYSHTNDLMLKYSDLRNFMNQVSIDDILELEKSLERKFLPTYKYYEGKKEDNKILCNYYLDILTKFCIKLIESDYKRMNTLKFNLNRSKFSKFEIFYLNYALLLQVQRLLLYPPDERRMNKNSRAILLIKKLRKSDAQILDIIKSLSSQELDIIVENIRKHLQPNKISIEPTYKSFKERLKKDS